MCGMFVSRSITAGFKRLSVGVLFLALYATLGAVFTDEYLLSKDFKVRFKIKFVFFH